MNQKRRVGIAGYGVVGRRRHEIIDQHPLLETVAVCDEKGIPESGAKGVQFFENYEQLLNVPLDLLFVSLPNYMAPEVVIAGLKKGLHVFCEKPPGRTVKDIEDVIAEEGKHPDLVLKYGFNHRYHESVQDALKIIQSGEYGPIVNLRGTYGKSKMHTLRGWRSERKYAGGGILLDQGIHMVDLMRLVCGEFSDVKSFVSNDYWNHDVEDNAYALMRTDRGQIAMLHSSATQWRHRFSLEISLREAYLRLEGILSSSKSYGQESLVIGRREEAMHGSVREETRNYLEDPSWKAEIFEFADAVIENKKILYGTSQDALETMKLVYQIYYADPSWRNEFGIDNPRAVRSPDPSRDLEVPFNG